MSIEKIGLCQQAQAYLKQAVAAVPGDPNGYIYLLAYRQRLLQTRANLPIRLKMIISRYKEIPGSGPVFSALSVITA